ncbi:TBCD1-like protein [Mya arenaria]|uniref:TBCD1-like protein n=1 Tax=Mya arenaria TaxID=6604 RepID=A0ABY7DWW3_MYAAR|nr:TBCD1-like protein [Mya arenaria]
MELETNVTVRAHRKAVCERPVSFYFGERKKSKEPIQEPSQFRRSSSMVNLPEAERAAMFSCWKNVHGEKHELESSTDSIPQLYSRENSMSDFSEMLIKSGKNISSSRASLLLPLSEEGISEWQQSTAEDFNGNEIVGNQELTAGRPDQIDTDLVTRNMKYDNLMRQNSFIATKVQLRNHDSLTVNRGRAMQRSSLGVLLGSQMQEKPDFDGTCQSDDSPYDNTDTRHGGIPAFGCRSAACRQTSYPGLREQTLIKNEAKRMSMPLPMMSRQEILNHQQHIIDSDAEVSDVVPELFKSIRGATQRDIFAEMEHKEPEPAKACFEVMYVGRAKVRGKKIFSSHIDDLVKRLEAKEFGIKPNGKDSSDRRRHKSDSSVKNLPTFFEENFVQENELQKLSHATIHQGVEFNSQSPTGSNEDVNKQTGSVIHNRNSDSTDHLSDGIHSSTENLHEGLHLSHSGDQLKEMFHSLHPHPEGHSMDGTGQGQECPGGQGRTVNRTMVFRVGQSEIALISLDKKQTIIDRKFKNISSVSQVDEIMTALRTSFQSAFQQSKLQTQQICINCPLHQYHNLCKDINGKTSNKSAFDLIRNRARKTLADSFESLLTNVHHKKEEFSSPPPSPTPGRPRSSTVGALPDTQAMEMMLERHKKNKQAEKKELEKRRLSESPMKHMFILANCSSPSKKSSTHMTPGEDDPPATSSDPSPQGSWRQAIFNRVVTPVKHLSNPTLEESLNEDEEGPHKKTSEELRALWRKAILETLLLIRMEKENIDLQARQDEADLKRRKLDYAEITPCLKDVTRSWEELLSMPGRPHTLVDQDKLIGYVKQGVPQSKRGEVWWFLVEQHRLRVPDLQENTPEVDYNELLKQLTNHQHAILIDLGRTFPGHPYFSLQLGSGQLALFNLLKAYSLMDHEVGYCQGLSFVAGILLMHMEELQAFEAWKHVMYNLGLRKQYKTNMIALQIQLYQLTRLLHDNYHDLYEHFEAHDIAPTLYAAPWFLTLFASQFPLGFVSRVFDLIFMQGSEVIFKVAMVLLGNHKELILHCDTFETIVEFIKTTLPEMSMIQMERVFDLDLSQQLHSYAVEYQVLKEEMMYSPAQGDSDQLARLELANDALTKQNMELIDKLQHAHSHERSLEIMIHNFQTQEAKLKSHIRTLELERSALLNAVQTLKQLIPEQDRNNFDINLPTLTPSMPVSPVHHGRIVGHDGIAITDTLPQGGSMNSNEQTDSSSEKDNFSKK